MIHVQQLKSLYIQGQASAKYIRVISDYNRQGVAALETPEEEEEFKQNFPNLVDEVLKTREPNDHRPVLLMAQDEGRFGRLGRVMKAWCPSGHRPIVAKQGVRDYVYAYAAVAPALGKMTSLVLPFVNIKMRELFLQEVSQDFADYFILIQVDQASWHISDKLNIPENIRLIPQTSRSPELNPVEHLS